MKAKKGISLIVLVITIIVIIILAGAVILSLQNNNPIEQAQKAQYVSDKDSIQSEVTLALSTAMARGNEAYTVVPDEGKAYKTLNGGASSLEIISTSKNRETITLDEPLPGGTGATWYVSTTGKVYFVINGYDVSDSNFNSTGDAGPFSPDTNIPAPTTGD